MRRASIMAVVLAGVLAGPAQAADQTIATVTRATGIDAYRGHTVWSAYDAAAKTYSLTEHFQGRTRTLAAPPSKQPLDVDLGPGPNGGVRAVFARCRKVLDPLGGDPAGCDLYSLALASDHMVKLRAASAGKDEYWPTIWGKRIAFVRYAGAAPRVQMYWQKLSGGPAHVLNGGRRIPEDGPMPEGLDLRGRDLTYIYAYEYGG